MQPFGGFHRPLGSPASAGRRRRTPPRARSPRALRQPVVRPAESTPSLRPVGWLRARDQGVPPGSARRTRADRQEREGWPARPGCARGGRRGRCRGGRDRACDPRLAAAARPGGGGDDRLGRRRRRDQGSPGRACDLGGRVPADPAVDRRDRDEESHAEGARRGVRHRGGRQRERHHHDGVPRGRRGGEDPRHLHGRHQRPGPRSLRPIRTTTPQCSCRSASRRWSCRPCSAVASRSVTRRTPSGTHSASSTRLPPASSPGSTAR